MKVTIKSAYGANGNQYYFAENPDSELFCTYDNGSSFAKDRTPSCWQFDSLEKLESELEKYKKFHAEPQIVKEIEI